MRVCAYSVYAMINFELFKWSTRIQFDFRQCGLCVRAVRARALMYSRRLIAFCDLFIIIFLLCVMWLWFGVL